ncbi:unnamed protein product [Helicobacter felis ATCC 49179]|uniref:Uncharacterized protein n=1 Tax=Helicobacter felis (strain ATCC 49179 / CCUG 28539 / NCTC 12436 / CS1) TaxID=936155 RepID=E7ACV2_HELFC|nr:unnamed protein product [Helicobacter felis ATCC 49179]
MLTRLIYRLNSLSEDKEKSQRFSIGEYTCFLNLQEIENQIIVEVHQSGGGGG